MIGLAAPGDPTTPTGGYVYNAKLIAASDGAAAPLRLPGGFPLADDAALAETAQRLSAWDGPLLIDGLAFGALPVELIRALPRRPVALCHHPLGWETGLDPAAAARLVESERRALAEAAAVIVTSETTKSDLVAHFDVPAARISVAPPGLDRPAAPRRQPAKPPIILTVASLTPRKDHGALIAALSRVEGLDWRAVWAGPDDRAPDHAADLRAQLDEAGLAERVDLVGPVTADRLAGLYAAATLFCLPSRYEGYGMVFAEAMAHGLPIIGCDAGAVRALAPPEAAILTPVGDTAALAEALATLLRDPTLGARMGAAGRARAAALPDWAAAWAVVAAAMAQA